MTAKELGSIPVVRINRYLGPEWLEHMSKLLRHVQQADELQQAETMYCELDAVVGEEFAQTYNACLKAVARWARGSGQQGGPLSHSHGVSEFWRAYRATYGEQDCPGPETAEQATAIRRALEAVPDRVNDILMAVETQDEAGAEQRQLSHQQAHDLACRTYDEAEAAIWAAAAEEGRHLTAFDVSEGSDVDLPCFDPNRAASHLPGAGEGPDVTPPAPPGRFGYDDACVRLCPAYRLLEEHESGDRQGLGAVRGLVNVLIGLLSLAVFAGLTFWAGTRF